MNSVPQAVERGARVSFIPPPFYYGSAFAVGMLADKLLVALPVRPSPAASAVGAVILAAGLALNAGGVAGVIRHRTTIVPHRPVRALIRTGAYRLSRNPMYTGLAITYAGGALLAGSWWPIILLPLVLLAIRRLVIDREEIYLAERFGDSYAEYRARVRRWL